MFVVGSAQQATVLDSVVWFLILWVTSALLLEGIVIDLLVKVARKATSNRSSQRAACLRFRWLPTSHTLDNKLASLLSSFEA
jgi:hypothetical protein